MFARLATWLGRWPIALALSALLGAVVLLPGLGVAGLWEPQERAVSDQKAPRPEIQAQRDKAEADAEAAKAAKAAKATGSAAAAASAASVGSAAGSAGSAAAGSAAVAAPAAPVAPPPTSAPATTAPSAPGTAGVGAPSSPTTKPKAATALALPPPGDGSDGCPRVAPKDATARSLTGRAAAWGRDTFGDDDAGRRLPLALLGLLTALAIAGTTMRLAGPRAGLIACAVGLSFPLLVLQSRQLTSEIGTACGASLVIYGAVALGTLRATALGALDGLLAALAVAAGLYLGFSGGGALLGVIVPLGAVGLAGGLGIPALRARASWPRGVVALIAGLLALAVLAILVHQIFDWTEPKLGVVPPQRALLGKAILSSPCWSTALGGTWRADDDTRYIFDSTWEQIAYGTYPWGVLAPIALAALVSARDPKRRQLGAIALAWAGCAWVATEVFQRKVGFTLFAGFPALAIAVGAWLDGLFAPRDAGDDGRGMPRGAMLIGLFAILAMLDIGKDMNEFADKVSALLVGGDGITYPPQAHLLMLPAKLWILIVGMLVALAIGLALLLWRDTPARRRLAAKLGAAAVGMTVVAAAFWAFAWQPRLSEHLSSKAMFDTYLELRKPGEALVMMGDLGDAAHDYVPDTAPEIMSSREQVVHALGRPERVFAIVSSGERCQLHREIGGKNYFVIDDRNTRDLLLSNKLDGTTDKNPLAVAMIREEPKDIPQKPKAKLVYDNRIQLLGWDIPKSVGRNEKFTVTMYYRVTQQVSGQWHIFMHFDGPQALRFNGDHFPIDELCPTSTWQAGDYIIDRHTVTSGGGAFPSGNYDVWTGFFTGSNPNFKNMAISEAPGDMRILPRPTAPWTGSRSRRSRWSDSRRGVYDRERWSRRAKAPPTRWTRSWPRSLHPATASAALRRACSSTSRSTMRARTTTCSRTSRTSARPASSCARPPPRRRARC